MTRAHVLVALMALGFVAVPFVASSQSTSGNTACFLTATNISVCPTAGATPGPVTTAAPGDQFVSFATGNAVASRFTVQIILPASGSNMTVQGNVSNTSSGFVALINTGGTNPAALTLPTFPIGATTFIALQIDQVTGQADLLTSSSTYPTAQAVNKNVVWHALLPPGLTAANLIFGTVVRP